MVKLNKKIRRYLTLVLCLSILLVPVEGYAAKNNQSTNQRVKTTMTAAGWVSSGGRWWYRNADGSYPKSTWKLINGSWYYFESDGWMATGWKKLGGEWYYLTSSGAMATGWVKLNGKYYFMNGSGVMQHDTWVDNGAYYVNSDGVWVEGKTSQNKAESSQTVSTAGWVSSGGRWWYREADGSYPRNNWKVINGSWYYFDGSGWMVTGWLKRAGGRYYLEPGNGNMVTGWRKIGGTWYYLNPGNGDMATGWTTIGGTRYYMNQDGAMVVGWLQLGSDWYYMNGSGAMLTGWQKIGSDWYYMNGSGAMLTGWQKIGSDWYYMNGSGAMLTGWQKIGSDWYYMNGSGAMLTGWQKIGSTWYYMNGSGAMLTDWQNIDGSEYYFYSSGAMAVSTVIGGVEIGADGKASRTESQAIGTLTKFLKTMIQPVGNTLYVWGGGHDAWTDGDGLRIGMNPKWKQFYNQQGASYNYTKHRYEYQNGLDCSGLVSWAVYNTYNTKSNQKETAYSSTSTGFPAYLTNKGFGSHGKVSGGTFTPGDVVSMTGHVWVVLGMCSDGSLVIVHATPPVVQISGTVNTAGSTNSEAVKLANAYMKKYYSDAAGKYNLCIASKAYVNNVDRFQWSSSSMRDPDGLRNMTAAQVLEKLIGPQ
ncbi:N-acetylmuramoyl-L-alanine amidase family protein [Blautia sp. TF11-31AT]|nr:N-acetylmuramoyl-L-alanine amidase family protein [Blautia sp. TF11-31AT]